MAAGVLPRDGAIAHPAAQTGPSPKCKHTPAAAPRFPDFGGQPASQGPQARRSLVTAPGDRAGSLHRLQLRRPIPDPTRPPLGEAADLIPRELGALGSPAGMGRVRPACDRVALTVAGCGSRGSTGGDGHALESPSPAWPGGTVPEPEWPAGTSDGPCGLERTRWLSQPPGMRRAARNQRWESRPGHRSGQGLSPMPVLTVPSGTPGTSSPGWLVPGQLSRDLTCKTAVTTPSHTGWPRKGHRGRLATESRRGVKSFEGHMWGTQGSVAAGIPVPSRPSSGFGATCPRGLRTALPRSFCPHPSTVPDTCLLSAMLRVPAHRAGSCPRHLP